MWKEAESLPENIFEENKSTIFKSGDGDMVAIYLKEEKDEVVDWIVVTDDGDYYKVGASYMVWTKAGYNKAAWSENSGKKMVKEYMKTGKITTDPSYRS